MDIQEAQKKVDEWIGQFKEGYFPPLLMLARFMEELGELARVLSHRHGKTPKPSEKEGSLREELGDLFFLVLALSNVEGIELETVLNETLDKYNRRDGERWTRRQAEE